MFEETETKPIIGSAATSQRTPNKKPPAGSLDRTGGFLIVGPPATAGGSDYVRGGKTPCKAILK